METKFAWTDEAIGMLTRLRADGLSAAQIAMRLGPGATRNSVIGKARRLHLHGVQAQNSPVARIARYGRVGVSVPPKPIPERPKNEIEAASESLWVTMAGLGPHMCKWPHGDPLTAAFRFCGAPAKPTGVYCGRHFLIAYTSRSA